jgi:hypothetical protein
MELVLWRSFIEGADRHFARDLVKSFLNGALPDACREVLSDFMKDISLQGGDGKTQGFAVYRGVQTAWRTQTGWSRLLLTNLPVEDAPLFIVQVAPNPRAPNARLVEDKRR